MKQEGKVLTQFRYRLQSGWSTKRGDPWIVGGYLSRKRLALSTVSRRLRASWRACPGEKIVAIELINEAKHEG